MKQKLFRGIVLLFLVYTAVELAFPQFCGEGPIGILGARSIVLAADQVSSDKIVPSRSEFVVKNSETTSPGLPQRDHEIPNDEDCFCCCAHVMPSRLFVNPETSALVISAGLQGRVSIPTGSLHAPYHPPRSA